MKPGRRTAFLLAGGLFGVLAFVCPSATPDWPAFWAASHLAGDSGLYSFEGINRITRVDWPADLMWAYLRPPIYAAALSPLAALDHYTAWTVWRLLQIAALLGAVRLLSNSPLALAIAVFSPPVACALKQSQDTPLVLLAIAGSLSLLQRNRIAAGAILACACALKPHLFLAVPVLILARPEWRLSIGIAAGGTVLYLSSAFVQGWSWPLAWFAMVRENERQLAVSGVVGWSFLHLVPVWVAVGLVGLLVWIAAKRLPLALALSVTIACALLLAPRMYLYDLTVCLPAVLLGVLSVGRSPAPRKDRPTE